MNKAKPSPEITSRANSESGCLVLVEKGGNSSVKRKRWSLFGHRTVDVSTYELSLTNPPTITCLPCSRGGCLLPLTHHCVSILAALSRKQKKRDARSSKKMINESWTVVADSPLSVGRFKSAGEASSQAPAFFDSPCLLLPCPRS